MESIFVLDASVVINILGCGSPERILRPLSGRCVVEENSAKEVLQNPFDKTPAADTLERLVGQGFLQVVKMSNPAYLEYLELVSAEPQVALGRGESAAIAYASSVGAGVVLDDRKARRISRERCPRISQSTSVALFRLAFEIDRTPAGEIAKLIRCAISHARMHVLDEDSGWVGSLDAEVTLSAKPS